MRGDKHQLKVDNRNELVYLLDEMLRRDYISHGDFQTMNNALAQSLPRGAGAGVEKYMVHSKVPPMMIKKHEDQEQEEEEEAEEQEIVQDVKSLIKSTINYVIKHEKGELTKLIKEFKDHDVALKLETLREKVLNNQ